MTNYPILAPAAVLAAWSMVVFLWLMVRRMPAFKEAGVDMTQSPPGGRYVDVEAQMPAKANWVSHNYTHLMEQPTVFYPVALMLAMIGDSSALSVNLAWAYAGLRILHSLWQINVNTLGIRFLFFGLASLSLIVLSVRLVLQVI